MSRKKRNDLFWGGVLRQIREETGFVQDDIAEALGYKGENKKSNISFIENAQVPINEEKIRKWVKVCGRTMAYFYYLAGEAEPKGGKNE
jgi:transcriptional regulator with XRE-family HTH domain